MTSPSPSASPHGKPYSAAVPQATLSLIRRPTILARTGMCNSSLHNAIVAGTFPAPVPTGPRTVAWVESEVNGWIEARIAERNARLDKQAALPVGQTKKTRGARA